MFPYVPECSEVRLERITLVFETRRHEHNCCEVEQCACLERKPRDSYEVTLARPEWKGESQRDRKHDYEREREHEHEHEHNREHYHERNEHDRERDHEQEHEHNREHYRERKETEHDREREHEHDYEHDGVERCCVASGTCPELYIGNFEIEKAPTLGEVSPRFEFPAEIGEVSHVYMFCHYAREVRVPSCDGHFEPSRDMTR